jgi:hypothetical protein
MNETTGICFRTPPSKSENKETCSKCNPNDILFRLTRKKRPHVAQTTKTTKPPLPPDFNVEEGARDWGALKKRPFL